MATRIQQHRRDSMRKHTRNGLDTQMRDFQAAMVNNLTASWVPSNTTASQTVFRNLNMLRGRSREQVQNNDYAKYFLTLLKSNVVGPQGFDFQAKILDAPGKPDVAASLAITAAFKDWSKPRNCDVLGRKSLAEFERQYIANVAADGEILCRLYKGSKYGKYGFKIKFIDPGYLDVTYNTVLSNGRYVEMSIEYDADNVPVAYHIVQPQMGNVSTLSTGYHLTGKRERIPAEEIIHCFIEERVDQPRGIPWMSTALLRMNMQGGWEEASLVNARAGAGKMGFLEEIGDLSQVFEKDADAGELIDQSDPGTWHKLPPGVKVSEYDPTYPNNEFAAFNKAILRGISAGLGVAYHTLANDLEGVNYSSGRLGSQNEREMWTVLQDWMKECFLFRLYDEWLQRQMVMGTLRLPKGGALRSSQEDKYKSVDFQGRRWSGVDPKKEADANQTDYGMRTKSLSGIIREKGQDPDQVWAEIASDQKQLEALGIAIVPPPAPGEGEPADKPDDDESGKDE